MKKVIVALTLILGLSFGTFAQDYSVKRGYKGFVDFGYTTIIEGYNSGKIDVVTSHGFQFNPYLYVGVGFAVECYTKSTFMAMPFFVNVRVTPLNGKVTPYVDLKGGHNALGYFEGLYLSPTLGCRIGLTRKVGLNVGIGYTLQQTNTKYYEWDPLNKLENKTINIDGLTFRFGFDF